MLSFFGGMKVPDLFRYPSPAFFLLMLEHMKEYLSRPFLYVLHVKRSGCQAHVVSACIEEGDVRTMVLGSVDVRSEWEEDVAGLLVWWVATLFASRERPRSTGRRRSGRFVSWIVQLDRSR